MFKRRLERVSKIKINVPVSVQSESHSFSIDIYIQAVLGHLEERGQTVFTIHPGRGSRHSHVMAYNLNPQLLVQAIMRSDMRIM